MDKSRFLEASKCLADEIWRRRLHARDGSVTWRGPGNPPPGTAIQSTVLGPHLYGGIAGIAIFFGALAYVTGIDQYRTFALTTLLPLRKKFQAILSDPERLARLRLGVGGLVGLGGLIYSFLRVGRWLDDPQLVLEACSLAGLFTPERIAEDNSLDIVAGSAGAILALLALSGETPETVEGRDPIQIALSCARNLLIKRDVLNGSARAWKTIAGYPPMTGFAHGVAGISYSLARLFHQTGDSDLRDAALEGITFERSTYSPEHRNWRDMRFTLPTFMVSWCHGAPGIGLGRLGVLDVLEDPILREEAREALETTRSTPLASLDHICCGNLGRVDILLCAYQQMGSPECMEAAQNLADAVLDRATKNGAFNWVFGGDKTFDPSLFTGAAGAGYTFLRLVELDRLPSLLLLR